MIEKIETPGETPFGIDDLPHFLVCDSSSPENSPVRRIDEQHFCQLRLDPLCTFGMRLEVFGPSAPYSEFSARLKRLKRS